MTTRTSVQQSLAALVACDQAYFESGQVNPGDSLAVLPDGPATPNPNPALYTDSPAFSIPAGYTVAAVIERAEIGARIIGDRPRFLVVFNRLISTLSPCLAAHAFLCQTPRCT